MILRLLCRAICTGLKRRLAIEATEFLTPSIEVLDSAIARAKAADDDAARAWRRVGGLRADLTAELELNLKEAHRD